MGGKRAAPTCGFIEFAVPLSCSKSKPKSTKNLTNKRGMEKTTTTVYKDEFPGGTSMQFSKKQRMKEYVDKNTGRLSCKEELTYKSTLKVYDDEVQGFFNEVQTQVKFKKSPNPSKNNKKIINKHIAYDF